MNFERYFLGIDWPFGGITFGFEYPITVLLLQKVSSSNEFPYSCSPLRPKGTKRMAHIVKPWLCSDTSQTNSESQPRPQKVNLGPRLKHNTEFV
ncbi:hypothetical protein TNCV_3482391 [Trichonephila clavipes]|nr:hypothetical protein TNCV_3482391 [Trichonephila clavipes]